MARREAQEFGCPEPIGGGKAEGQAEASTSENFRGGRQELIKAFNKRFPENQGRDASARRAANSITG